ncbi:MAG: hypothetical protein PWQ25_2102 [Deferribacteres bacterium]|jgi:hypothetical protein|nr:hypothetical protein [Deferribacteres bacterium]
MTLIFLASSGWVLASLSSDSLLFVAISTFLVATAIAFPSWLDTVTL